MKRYLEVLLGLSIIASIVFASSCKRTEQEGCSGCCEEPGQIMEFKNDSSGKAYRFQFYNAMTPTNYPYCYYEEVATGVYAEVDGTCRPNYDTVFNETSSQLNDVFQIKDYNPSTLKEDGYRTALKIMTLDDTTAIWEHSEKLMYGESIFDGRSAYSNLYGYGEKKPFKSGRYRYIFYVYDKKYDITTDFVNPFDDYTEEQLFLMQLEDPAQYIALEELYAENEKNANTEIKVEEFLLDSVTGVFCIIRNDYDCSVSGCVGYDSGDPLLQ